MFLLVPAYPGSSGQKAVKRLCVCVCVCVCLVVSVAVGVAEITLAVLLLAILPVTLV